MRRAARSAALLALLVLLDCGAATPVAAAPPSDAWLEGYATAVLERDLGLVVPSLRVSQGVLTVSAAELVNVDRARVLSTLRSIPGVTRVEIVETAPPRAGILGAPPRRPAEWETGVLPGGTLFRPLIADPRWPHFAASYHRYLSDRQLTDVGAVSFGETFTLIRERAGASSWWEVGIQAGVFAVFDLAAESMDLVNADYFVGVPLSGRWGDWSAIFRLFHQSSHLGDEFLLRATTERVNLSYESVDLKVSREFGDVLRLYAGGGYLFDQEPASLDPWSIQYGVEVISPWPGRDAGWRPIVAGDLQHREENDWSLDLSLRAGIQIDGVLASRSLQILLEYFKGRSPNGQFYKDKIEYLGLGAHFHF
jgi:Protein of unknown function (DUF1207)